MLKRIFKLTILTIGGCAAVLVVMALMKNPAVRTQPVAEAPLELLEAAGEVGDSMTTITGRIRNNTAKKYTYVQVTYQLYNDADEQVGTALANVNGLEPGSVWKFKAVGLAQGARFKLDKISGF